jgi:Ran GTPase-activating protein (RanGAP) involved in mRNA processing and transport
LNFNFLGRVGADALAQMLETSSNLFSLSIQSCRLEGRDVRRLSVALQQNKVLRYLNIGSNKLGDEGAQLLAEALTSNQSIEYLDMFDVDFGNNTAFAFQNLL